MKKEVIRSSDGKRTVGMYPESLRETTFIYNDKYKEKYEWPEDQHNLISPSRVFNLTEDASGLENWRKRVGEEEAERETAAGEGQAAEALTWLGPAIIFSSQSAGRLFAR